MKKLSLVLIIILFLVSSCKEEEVPPPATLTFASKATVVAENDGLVLITLNLDKAAYRDIVVDFTITGSAQLDVDYETTASATIREGATTGDLSITLIDDSDFEFDRDLIDLAGILGKTLEISLARITGNALPSENTDEISHLLVIKENEEVEKSLSIDLSWDSGDGTPGDVDMDLALFFIDPDDGPIFLAASASVGIGFEKITIGTPAPNGMYGLAFRYYEGMSDNVTFTAKFISQKGTLPGGVTEASYVGVYSQANINGEENNPVHIVQTFEKQESDYITISDISIPASGSRGKWMQGNAPARGLSSGVVF
ncbi:MAG TPA: Calx-beta domain-containing protein [Cyclobacteriaceae bacterium]|nr:Calx-beta domain-containing protein [Cyclobacteriaceae bacterium]